MKKLEKDASGALRFAKEGRVDPPDSTLCVAYKMADFSGIKWVERYFTFDRRGSAQLVMLHDGTVWDDENGFVRPTSTGD